MRILVLPLKKIGGVRAPLAPPVPTTLCSKLLPYASHLSAIFLTVLAG